MSVNRVFIFHETSDNFRAADFDGTLVPADNWDPSLTTIRGAAADAAGNIFVLDLSTNPATVRRWDAAQTRQATLDITLNNTGAYEGIAVTDTHLVALRGEGLQYYDLMMGGYVSSMDASLPSLTSPEVYSGICRAGDFLFIVTEDTGSYTPRIYKRNLDGSAVSDWAGQASTTALTIFATTEHVVTVRKNGGHWDRWSFDGIQDTTLNTIGSGLWQASYTTYEQLSIEAIDEQMIPVLTEDYKLEIDIGGSPKRAYVDGDMEGFYQSLDADNAKILIKSQLVTRLIQSAIWRVHLVRGTDTLDSEIIYNVVPTAPVIEDPGPLKLYKGVPFNLDIAIANRPTISRAGSLLVGLKHTPRGDGEEGLNIGGLLPADAVLTETSFNAVIYAENPGGHDNLAVPITIETGSPPPIMGLTPQLGLLENSNAGQQTAAFTWNSVEGARSFEWTTESGDDAKWSSMGAGELTKDLKLSNDARRIDIPQLNSAGALRIRVRQPWQGDAVSFRTPGVPSHIRDDTAGSAHRSQVWIRWNDPVPNLGHSKAFSRVRGRINGGSWIEESGNRTPAFIFHGLTPGATVNCDLQWKNALGWGEIASVSAVVAID